MAHSKAHVFTAAGLGESPFAFTGIRENLFRAGDSIKAGGSCDFCGTGIRWEYGIISVDGVKSVVGSDCIHKAGDKGLFDVAKKAKRDHDNEIKRLEREAAYEARLDSERKVNGGATDFEREDADRIAREFDRRIAIAPAIAILSGLADTLEGDHYYGFRSDVAAKFRAGERVTNNVARIAAEIIAKDVGRKNSKAWKARFEVVDAEIKSALKLIDDVA